MQSLIIQKRGGRRARVRLLNWRSIEKREYEEKTNGNVSSAKGKIKGEERSTLYNLGILQKREDLQAGYLTKERALHWAEEKGKRMTK